MNTGRGLDLTVEFISAIALYGGLGWFADRWLGTAPWLLVAGCVLGNACGLYLLYRRGLEQPGRPESTDPPDVDQRTAA